MNRRHDSIAIFLDNFVFNAGLYSQREPPLHEDSRRRGDLEVHLGLNRYLVDISIAHPSAPSVVQSSASAPATAFLASKRRETLKISKYDDEAKAAGFCFWPFVLDST